MPFDKTEVRQALCGESRFVEQEHPRRWGVAVSDALTFRVRVFIPLPPFLCGTRRRFAGKAAQFRFWRKTADDLFQKQIVSSISQVINKLKDGGGGRGGGGGEGSRRQKERQILGGFNWNNISRGSVVLFPLAIEMFHFMPPCALLFPTSSHSDCTCLRHHWPISSPIKCFSFLSSCVWLLKMMQIPN